MNKISFYFYLLACIGFLGKTAPLFCSESSDTSGSEHTEYISQNVRILSIMSGGIVGALASNILAQLSTIERDSLPTPLFYMLGHGHCTDRNIALRLTIFGSVAGSLLTWAILSILQFKNSISVDTSQSGAFGST
jgi:hypothetical protein